MHFKVISFYIFFVVCCDTFLPLASEFRSIMSRGNLTKNGFLWQYQVLQNVINFRHLHLRKYYGIYQFRNCFSISMSFKNPVFHQLNFSRSWTLKYQINVLVRFTERSELRIHLSGQKLIKNAKNDPFWRVFKNLKVKVKQCYQTDQF